MGGVEVEGVWDGVEVKCVWVAWKFMVLWWRRRSGSVRLYLLVMGIIRFVA
jgi:hypothetical protein